MATIPYQPRDSHLAQVTDEVRLEGHGLIAHTTAPASEKVGDLWLPIAPTAPPVIRPVGGGRRLTDSTSADPGGGSAAQARLLAQQAMDEARLGLGNDEKPATSGNEKAGHGSKQKPGNGDDLESSWCCVCSEDAAVRCRDCEKENEGNVPELFCARCFNDVHRGDPEMESHRPQAFSSQDGAGERLKEDSGRRRVFGWRRR